MRREILALQRRLGITMLYVTHDQTEAMGMADQIVLLREGRIEQDAPPEDLCPAGDAVRRQLHRHTADEPVSAGTPRWRYGVARHRPARCCAGHRRTRRIGGIRPGGHLRLAEAGIPAVVRDAREYLGADTVMACIGRRSNIARTLARARDFAGEGAPVSLPRTRPRMCSTLPPASAR